MTRDVTSPMPKQQMTKHKHRRRVRLWRRSILQRDVDGLLGHHAGFHGHSAIRAQRITVETMCSSVSGVQIERTT